MNKESEMQLRGKLKELVDQEVRNTKGPEVSKVRTRLDQYLEALVSEVEKK
jgi:hypothetical protein